MKKATLWVKTIAAIMVVIFSYTSIALSSPDVYRIKVPEKYGKVTSRYKAAGTHSPLSKGVPEKAGDVNDNGNKNEIVYNPLAPFNKGEFEYQRQSAQNNRTVILVEDAHTSREAQENIAQVIGHVVKEEDVKTVAVEGAVGTIDIESFRSFPITEARDTVAHEYMTSGIFTGAEYGAITNKTSFSLFGAEDEALFHTNFRTFYRTMIQREESVKELVALEAVFTHLKEVLYNPALKQCDDAVSLYRSGALDLVSFVPTIFMHLSEKDIDMLLYPELGRFHEVIVREGSVNLSAAQEERAALLEILYGNLTAQDTSSLCAFEKQYMGKSITEKEWSQCVRAFAQRIHIDMTRYQNFLAYVQYLDQFSSIDFSRLIREIDVASHYVLTVLAHTPEEKELVVDGYHVWLLKKLCELRGVSEEVEYFRAHRDAFSLKELYARVSLLAHTYGIATHSLTETRIEEILPLVESFYADADARSRALVENTLTRMEQDGQSVGVLVTGGFHTQGIQEALRSRGIDYLVVTPQISSLTEDVPYIEKMTGKLFPLAPQLTSTIILSAIYDGTIQDEGTWNQFIAQFDRKGTAQAMSHVDQNNVGDIAESLVSLRERGNWEALVQTIRDLVQNKAQGTNEKLSASEIEELLYDNTFRSELAQVLAPVASEKSSESSPVLTWGETCRQFMNTHGDAWVCKFDMKKLWDRNNVYGREIVDSIGIGIVERVLKQVIIDTEVGIAHRQGGDEFEAMLLPTLDAQEVEEILYRVQKEVERQIDGIYDAVIIKDVNVDMENREASEWGSITKLISDKKVLVTAPKPRLLKESTQDMVMLVTENEKNTTLAQVQSLNKSYQVIPVYVPWIPVGVVKVSDVSSQGDLEKQLAKAWEEADYTQSMGKERAALVSRGITERKEGKNNVSSMREYKGYEAQINERTQMIRDRYEQNGATRDDMNDDGYPNIARRFLWKYVQKAKADTKKSIAIIRGPPDTFFVVVKTNTGSEQVIRISPTYRTQDETLFKGAAGSRDIAHGFGFKVLNEVFGHAFGNMMIKQIGGVLHDVCAKDGGWEISKTKEDIQKLLRDAQEQITGELKGLMDSPEWKDKETGFPQFSIHFDAAMVDLESTDMDERRMLDILEILALPRVYSVMQNANSEDPRIYNYRDISHDDKQRIDAAVSLEEREKREKSIEVIRNDDEKVRSSEKNQDLVSFRKAESVTGLSPQDSSYIRSASWEEIKKMIMEGSQGSKNMIPRLEEKYGRASWYVKDLNLQDLYDGAPLLIKKVNRRVPKIESLINVTSELPPIMVVKEGGVFTIPDGAHRFLAAYEKYLQRKGSNSIRAFYTEIDSKKSSILPKSKLWVLVMPFVYLISLLMPSNGDAAMLNSSVLASLSSVIRQEHFYQDPLMWLVALGVFAIAAMVMGAAGGIFLFNNENPHESLPSLEAFLTTRDSSDSPQRQTKRAVSVLEGFTNFHEKEVDVPVSRNVVKASQGWHYQPVAISDSLREFIARVNPGRISDLRRDNMNGAYVLYYDAQPVSLLVEFEDAYGNRQSRYIPFWCVDSTVTEGMYEFDERNNLLKGVISEVVYADAPGIDPQLLALDSWLRTKLITKYYRNTDFPVVSASLDSSPQSRNEIMISVSPPTQPHRRMVDLTKMNVDDLSIMAKLSMPSAEMPFVETDWELFQAIVGELKGRNIECKVFAGPEFEGPKKLYDEKLPKGKWMKPDSNYRSPIYDSFIGQSISFGYAIENIMQHVKDGIALVIRKEKIWNGVPYYEIEVHDNGTGFIDRDAVSVSIQKAIEAPRQRGEGGEKGEALEYIAASPLLIIKQSEESALISRKSIVKRIKEDAPLRFYGTTIVFVECDEKALQDSDRYQDFVDHIGMRLSEDTIFMDTYSGKSSLIIEDERAVASFVQQYPFHRKAVEYIFTAMKQKVKGSYSIEVLTDVPSSFQSLHGAVQVWDDQRRIVLCLDHLNALYAYDVKDTENKNEGELVLQELVAHALSGEEGALSTMAHNFWMWYQKRIAYNANEIALNGDVVTVLNRIKDAHEKGEQIASLTLLTERKHYAHYEALVQPLIININRRVGFELIRLSSMQAAEKYSKDRTIVLVASSQEAEIMKKQGYTSYIMHSSIYDSLFVSLLLNMVKRINNTSENEVQKIFQSIKDSLLSDTNGILSLAVSFAEEAIAAAQKGREFRIAA